MSLRRGLAWMTLSQGGFFVLQFGGSVVLARLLTPYEMGVYAVAVAITGVLGAIQAFGLTGFMVREQDMSQQLLASAFTVNAALAALLSAAVAGLSTFGGQFLREAGVRQVMLVLALLHLLGALEFVPSASLERRGQFKSIALVSLARMLSSTALSVGLAFAGFSYMSIAYGNLAGAVVSLAGFNIVGRRHVSFRVSFAEWRRVTRFGLQMLAISGVNAVSSRTGEFLLGRLLGLSALGLYSRASSLNSLLWDNIHLVIGRVVFVDLASLRRDGVSLRDSYLRTLDIVTAPALAGLRRFRHPGWPADPRRVRRAMDWRGGAAEHAVHRVHHTGLDHHDMGNLRGVRGDRPPGALRGFPHRRRPAPVLRWLPRKPDRGRRQPHRRGVLLRVHVPAAPGTHDGDDRARVRPHLSPQRVADAGRGRALGDVDGDLRMVRARADRLRARHHRGRFGGLAARASAFASFPACGVGANPVIGATGDQTADGVSGKEVLMVSHQNQGNVEQAQAPHGLTDLFSSSYGSRQGRSWRSRRLGRVTDAAFAGRLALNPFYRGLRARAARAPMRKILVTSVDVPAQRAALNEVMRKLQASRHDVTVKLTPMGGRGKYQNINVGLSDADLEHFDWLLVVDDDVDLPPDFLDVFLLVAELADLRICQPAHRFRSYTSWEVTQRMWNSLAHVTRFVECGPITAFHRSAFPFCLPFPDTRWAWGIDVLWSDIAIRQGFRMGIVDATPIGHLREVSASYDRQDAISESRQMLARFNVRHDSRELLQTLEVIHEL